MARLLAYVTASFTFVALLSAGVSGSCWPVFGTAAAVAVLVVVYAKFERPPDP